MSDALTTALAARLAALGEQAEASAKRHDADASKQRQRARQLDRVINALLVGRAIDADLLLAVAYPPMLAPLFGSKGGAPRPLAALVASLGKEPTP